MAFDSYANLQLTIAVWLMRDDLTANIPDFITLCEGRNNRRIRVREMETTATLSPETVADVDSDLFDSGLFDTFLFDAGSGEVLSVNGYLLPDDYIEARRVQANTDPTNVLTPLSLDMLAQYGPAGGYPYHYTITGGYMVVRPANPATIGLTYYAKIPALSDANTSNWLLEKAPEVYLYGSLLESAPFMEDDNRLATWISLYKAAVDELLQVDTRGVWSKAVARIRGYTP